MRLVGGYFEGDLRKIIHWSKLNNFDMLIVKGNLLTYVKQLCEGHANFT